MSIFLDSFSDFEVFGNEVSRKKLSIFLDFDGTLAAIADTPDLARLSPASREAVAGLSSIYPVAIVSGRGLDDLTEKVGLGGVAFAANHGMAIRSAMRGKAAEGFEMDCDIGPKKKAAIRELSKAACELQRHYEGLILEDKGATLSLHYRLVGGEQVAGLIKDLNVLLAPFKERGLVKITTGKKVIELRPQIDWDKGRAVGWILGREPFISTFPIYIGDDETDRDGFRAVKGIGASIHVGDEDDEADYHMQQSSVLGFIRWLVEQGS